MAIQPLRRALTIQSLLAIILPFGVVVLFGVFWILPQIRKDAGERQLLLARAVGMQVESHLEAGAVIVRAAAAMPNDSKLPEHGFQQHLETLLGSTDSMSSLYMVAADGKVFFMALKNDMRSHQTDLASLNLSRNPLFHEISQGSKPLWSETFLSVVNGGLTVAYGVRSNGSAVIGEVDLALLTKFLKQISTEKESLILIIDHKGQVVADNNGHYTAQQLNIGNIPLIRTGIAKDAPITGRFDFTGLTMTGSIVQISGVDWHVVVAQDNTSLYDTSRDIALIVIVGLLIALLCAMMTSVYLARKIATRFDELTDHAQNIAEGAKSGEWPTSHIEEFNQLSATLQQMARQLQDSETLYRTLFEQLPEGIVVWTLPELRPLQFNTAAHKLLGYTHEEFSRLTVSDLEALHDKNRLLALQEKVNQEGTASFETTHRTKTGGYRSMSITLRMIELGGSPMILALHRNITERKQIEEALQESKELFTLFMKYSPVYTFIKQIEGDKSRVIQISDNFIDMIGRPAEELRGHTMDELFPADFARKITADDISVLKEGKVLRLDEELNGLKYTTIKFPIFREGKNSLIAGFTIDITEQKRVEEERLGLEKQMLHAQKLESLGVLAGGIAHDFNNILTAIIGNADLALMRINKESPAVDNLHRIEQAASRAADLAKQMLAYSGKGKFVVENLDLNILLEEMLHMLEVSISKKAVLRLNQFEHLPAVEADATQMRQIIMNLVINASEAIGDKSGVIAITTGCMDCDQSYLKDVWLDENLIDGLYVYLEIADTGCGMDKETLAKLFDPFFTTKFTGRGLGMAAVLGIVRGHKGAIKVYSEPKKGTTFKILLPASNRPSEIFNGDKHQDDWKGSGTVLLVDDEETIRGIGTEMLKELGFTTITADDGREGLAAFKQNPDIKFVILDLTMPHMDGEQCFRELRQFKPDVKVIMSSGYNEQEVTQRFVGKGLAGFIQKPYKLSALKEVIRMCERA